MNEGIYMDTKESFVPGIDSGEEHNPQIVSSKSELEELSLELAKTNY